MRLIGTPISPYVRKAIAILDRKKIDFEIAPVVAFFADDRLTELNPLRRIPVLIDSDLVIADSSVIAAYFKQSAAARAADRRMMRRR